MPTCFARLLIVWMGGRGIIPGTRAPVADVAVFIVDVTLTDPITARMIFNAATRYLEGKASAGDANLFRTIGNRIMGGRGDVWTCGYCGHFQDKFICSAPYGFCAQCGYPKGSSNEVQALEVDGACIRCGWPECVCRDNRMGTVQGYDADG